MSLDEPLRVTETVISSDGWCAPTCAVRSSAVVIALPSIAVITSPAFRPALSAGEPLTTVVICAPRRRRVRDADAEVGVLHLAAGDERVRDALRRVDRDREADAVVAAGVALDLRVDADHLAAEVQQRAAGVAVVDRGVGLDRAGDRVVVRRRDRAVDAR